MLLSVVLRPVCGEDPSFTVEAAKRRGSGHRNDHTDGCNVDTCRVEELGRAAKDSDVVVIESEHDPEVNRDAVMMQVRDEPPIVVDPVVGLVRRFEALLGNRLEAQEQSLVQPLRAASSTNSSSRAALAVHWLVHHFFSGTSALNSSFA